MKRPIVVKISGHELEDPIFLSDFASTIAAIDAPVIVVHGGGKEISATQQVFGIEPHYIDGVRVTDEPSMAVVTMVLCGLVNKRLVRYLCAAGLDAQGISGVDRGLIRAHKMPHETLDMGFTGEVQQVRGDLLAGLLEQGITPVIAPVCLGEDSEYNVNGDHVAGAVAVAIDAERVIFLSNVEGVLMNGELVPALTHPERQNVHRFGNCLFV